jgi:hypothetical protein
MLFKENGAAEMPVLSLTSSSSSAQPGCTGRRFFHPLTFRPLVLVGTTVQCSRLFAIAKSKPPISAALAARYDFSKHFEHLVAFTVSILEASGQPFVSGIFYEFVMPESQPGVSDSGTAQE